MIDEDGIIQLIDENFNKGHIIISYSSAEVADSVVKFLKELHPSFKCSCSAIFFMWVIIITWRGAEVSMFSSHDITASIDNNGRIKHW